MVEKFGLRKRKRKEEVREKKESREKGERKYVGD